MSNYHAILFFFFFLAVYYARSGNVAVTSVRMGGPCEGVKPLDPGGTNTESRRGEACAIGELIHPIRDKEKNFQVGRGDPKLKYNGN